MTMEINVYVANLGKYNEGELVGKWVTLPTDLNELFVEIGLGQYDENGKYVHGVVEYDERGNSYHYEEYAIHDYEAPFSISEYSNLFALNEMAEQLDNLSSHEQEEVEMLLQTGEFNINEAIEALENGNYTIFTDCQTMEDVAYSWIHDHIGSIKDAVKNPEYYVNEAAIKRDLEIDGYFNEIEEENGIELSESDKENMVEEMIEDEVIKTENYFSYEKYGRDMEMNGNFYYIGNGVYIELHN